MATVEEVTLNEAHPPAENAIEAFNEVLDKIKADIIRSRNHWNAHEPQMWNRAQDISDKDLVDFTIENDLVLVRSGPTTYGTIIFGKIRLPAVKEDGEGFVHVRIHDPPNRGAEDIMYHSLFHYEGDRDEDGHPKTWRAVHFKDTPLEFFHA